MELRQSFFLIPVWLGVIDLKCQVKCEQLCDQEMLMLEFSGREYV